MRIHFGPVHFIAVDAENVGDISRFLPISSTAIHARKDISKQEKTNRAIILESVLRRIFSH